MNDKKRVIKREERIMASDTVHKPIHYTTGNIEVIDYIKDKLTQQQFIGYCLGNVIKYVSRYQHKGGKEDLEKALVYLTWSIENYSERK